MGFLSTASAWLDETLETSDSVPVRYRRGSGGPFVDLTTAVIGMTPQGFLISAGVTQTWSGTDWLIPAGDLVLSGEEVEPEIGDLITFTVRGEDVTYEVLSGDDGTPARKCDDATGAVWRIHTKQIG